MLVGKIAGLGKAYAITSPEADLAPPVAQPKKKKIAALARLANFKYKPVALETLWIPTGALFA